MAIWSLSPNPLFPVGALPPIAGWKRRKETVGGGGRSFLLWGKGERRGDHLEENCPENWGKLLSKILRNGKGKRGEVEGGKKEKINEVGFLN